MALQTRDGEVIGDIIQVGQMDSLQMQNISILAQSERFIDALTFQVTVNQSLIVSRTTYLRSRTNGIEKENCMAQSLLQEYLKTPSWSTLASPAVNAALFTPQTQPLSKADSDKERRRQHKPDTWCHNEKRRRTISPLQ